jgi:hypothetical protein
MNNALRSIGLLPEKKPGDVILYLVLSFLSGMLETGVLTAGLMRFDIRMGVAFALAYQVGCLVRNPLRLSLQGAACLLSCSLFLLLLGYDGAWVFLLMTTLVSAGVQTAREWLLREQYPVSIGVKRVVRVSGFIGGILGGGVIGLSLLAFVTITSCVIVLPIAIGQEPRSPWMNLNRRFVSDGYGWIMLLHQTHYFAYAYVLLAILLTHKGPFPGETILSQPVTASGWFALGWLSYISGRWLLEERLKMSSLQAVIWGHIWVAGCLLCMALFHNHPLMLGLAWILGGFGGGSVYAIKDLAKAYGYRADIELWEHWGHVAGVSLSLASILIFRRLLVLCQV